MAYTEVKTPIVYYGGKTSIMNYLLDMDPVDNIRIDNYNEPFFGGGAFFFAKKQARNETINDRLDLVINFYRTLKLKYNELKGLIEATLISRSIHNEAITYIRCYNKGIDVDKVKLAWSFWVCTNFAYSNKIGGGYKYSNHSSVSVPQTLINRKADFTELLVARIENAYIENDDAVKISRSRNTTKTFHYFDPPYPNADQGHYHGYGWDQYDELMKFCASECKGLFLLSSYNSEMLNAYINQFGWYKQEITHELKSPRKTGSKKVEVLVSNYQSPCGTLNLFTKTN